jgi:hypothetical protein
VEDSAEHYTLQEQSLNVFCVLNPEFFLNL